MTKEKREPFLETRNKTSLLIRLVEILYWPQIYCTKKKFFFFSRNRFSQARKFMGDKLFTIKCENFLLPVKRTKFKYFFHWSWIFLNFTKSFINKNFSIDSWLLSLNTVLHNKRSMPLNSLSKNCKTLIIFFLFLQNSSTWQCRTKYFSSAIRHT